MHPKKSINPIKQVNTKNPMNSINPAYFLYCILFIISGCMLILSTGCSTTQSQQSERAIPDLSESREIKSLTKDVKARIALFPFENFSDDIRATEKIMPLVRDKLESEGFSVLDGSTLERFLLKERIRSTGYVSRDTARKMGEELHVEAVLVGSINTCYSGRNHKAGFTARLINTSDGSIIWAGHAAATGDDFTGLLGLGTVRSIDKLTVRMIDKLLDSLSILPPHKEREATYRIAVMPFKNESKIKGAGMIATYMVIVELFRSRIFEPVSFGDVRNLVVALRVRSKGELDFKNIASIAESSGVDGILVGTVEHYSEEEGSVPPQALISARLIDARSGRILWYDGYQYRGDDGITILDWGRLRSAENVAHVAISKLVKDMSRVKWQ